MAPMTRMAGLLLASWFGLVANAFGLGGLAVSTSGGFWFGISNGFPTADAAAAAARSFCGQASCTLVGTMQDAWGTLVVASNNSVYWFAYAPTKQQAERLAMQWCKEASFGDCRVQVSWPDGIAPPRLTGIVVSPNAITSNGTAVISSVPAEAELGGCSSSDPSVVTVEGYSAKAKAGGAQITCGTDRGGYASAQLRFFAPPSTAVSDCLFNFAERTYPRYFSPVGAPSKSHVEPANAYYYRYYPDTKNYLATDAVNKHVWLMGQDFGPQPLDYGPLPAVSEMAGCVPIRGSQGAAYITWNSPSGVVVKDANGAEFAVFQGWRAVAALPGGNELQGLMVDESLQLLSSGRAIGVLEWDPLRNTAATFVCPGGQPMAITVAGNTSNHSCGVGSDPNVVGAGVVRLSGRVVDSTGQAVPGATVHHSYGSSAYSQLSDNSGNYRLDMKASDVAGINYPAVTVYKSGFVPTTLYYNKFSGGINYAGAPLLAPVGPNASIPEGAWFVRHLGDDNYSGAVNSQFQKGTDGVDYAFPISDWAAKYQAGYRTVALTVSVKGWQSLTRCPANQIGIAGNSGFPTQRGGDSPSDGSWGTFRFTFPMAQIGSQSAVIRMSSGICNGTSDRDDFEITGLRADFF